LRHSVIPFIGSISEHFFPEILNYLPFLARM
jgi:hypothetical protein